MKILGFDPGTHCGWCVMEDGRYIASGVVELASKGEFREGMRYVLCEASIEKLIAEHAPDLLAFEDVRRHVGTDAAHVYGGIVAIMMKLGATSSIPWIKIPVKMAKKFLSGNGNAKKEAMILAASSLVDKQITNDNEADAIGICHTASHKFNPIV